jgi:hypothetical protein
MKEQYDGSLGPAKTATKLFFDWPDLANDNLANAKEISEYMGCTVKRVYYLAGLKRLPIENATGT